MRRCNFCKMQFIKHLWSLFFLVGILCRGTCFASNVSEARRTLIITGASGEFGSAAARLLAPDYNLILTGRNLSKLGELKQELESCNPYQYEICTLDYMRQESIAHFNEYLAAKKSVISGFVLITPRPTFYGKALFQEEEVWHEVLQSAFIGPVEVLKGVLPHLANKGKIVVIAGTTSVQVQPDTGPACVIRRMWTTYTKALSHYLGPQGININAISPGIVLTKFHEDRIHNQADKNGITYDEQMQEEVANIPLRRHAKTEEVASAIRFLLSDESNFITGTNLILDGGFTTSY